MPRKAQPQPSYDESDNDNGSFDIELYENEGNQKPDRDSKTFKTEEAVAEIKDTKEWVYDNYKLLKCSLTANIFIIIVVVVILILAVLGVSGVISPAVTVQQRSDDKLTSVGVTSGVQAGTSDCPEGWVGDEGWLADGESINMGCLWFEQTAMRVYQAITFCAGKNSSRLVEIHTRPQKTFIRTKLLALDPRNYTSSHFWTGGTDSQYEGQWLWRSTKIGLHAWVWRYEQYKYNDGSSNDDLMLHKSYNYDGYSYNGGSYSYHPICQIPS